jgi:glycosyltransferase involved in cell wall biosynthesis
MTTTRPIRVAITYRVCQDWRSPIFRRLATEPQFQILVLHGQDVPGTKLLNTKNFDGIPHKELRTYAFRMRSTGRESTLTFHPGALAALYQFRPDIILCEGGSNVLTNLLIYTYAAFHRVPTVWWTLGYIPGRQHKGLSALFVRLTNILMHRSSVLLGYSSRAKRYFEISRCRQPQFVAVNCIDTDRAFRRVREARQSPIDVKRRLGLEAKTVLLFVGALTREKRVDDLLRAYTTIRSTRSDVALLVVGDGPDRARLEGVAATLRAPDVHFIGRVVEQVSHYFLAGDVFVLPGLGGLAISEAMAHGLPVICTVADGCEEDLIVPGQNGEIVPEGDEAALIGAITALLDDRTRLATYGAVSSQLIQTRYNVHTYLEGIVNALLCAYSLRQGTRGCSRRVDVDHATNG